MADISAIPGCIEKLSKFADTIERLSKVHHAIIKPIIKFISGVLDPVGSSGAGDQVRSLKRSRECMQRLLEEVDSIPKRARKDTKLAPFTKALRELDFRAEDAIDTYAVDVESKDDNMNFLLEVLHRKFRRNTVSRLIEEIEAIKRGAEEAKKNFELFAIDLPVASRQQQQHGSDIGSSSSRPMPELNNEIVVGIEGDVTLLVERLTNSEHDFKVLAIVGTGGAGKTTLASQIYRHHEVQSRFSHRVFISISQQWHATDLLQRIANKVMKTSGPSSQDELLEKLHDFMKDKQCLVVLDDIWHKEAWDAIRPIFSRTGGSRVMLTTRIKEVPRYADTRCLLYKPPLLTENQKWELFRTIAMEGRDKIEKKVEFERLGKQMSEKCHGLPLEVITLAGILRTKCYLYEWKQISQAYAKIIIGNGDSNYDVADMLELSYLDLPSHLKSCFLYLAIIPSDEDFSSTQFAQMLIAERLGTNDRQMGSTLEEKAMESLAELAYRCIIKVTKRDLQGRILKFKVHDLMRDFCINKADEDQFLTINPTADPDERESTQPRRISITSREYWPQENHRLRTILYSAGQTELQDWELKTIPNKFKLLRVLSIQHAGKVNLPDEIGELIHLRYLLLKCSISELPQSTKNLRNLLYFMVLSGNDGHVHEVKVPEKLVCKMEKLRTLYFNTKLKSSTGEGHGPNSLGLSGPKNMIKLSCHAGKWMEDLPRSSPTLQHLKLFGQLEKAEQIAAIYECPSILEGQLCTFKCKDGSGSTVVFDLQKLMNCSKLRSLVLSCRFAGNDTASTIQFPTDLVSLDLSRSGISGHINLMEVLGQLSTLKCLKLSSGSFLGSQISCGSTAFPLLQGLTLSELECLEEWRMEQGGMRCLETLKIEGCMKLKRLPECIRFITTLTDLHISAMSEEFCTRLRDGGEDSYIIAHIPTRRFS